MKLALRLLIWIPIFWVLFVLISFLFLLFQNDGVNHSNVKSAQEYQDSGTTKQVFDITFDYKLFSMSNVLSCFFTLSDVFEFDEQIQVEAPRE